MNKPTEPDIGKATDDIQQRLSDYACGLQYRHLSPDVIHAAKVRTIDTLGALVGGMFAEPSRIARNLAIRTPACNGATIIGTRSKTTPDMAAFVNATTARYAEMNDVYHWPGSYQGHPSDVVTPILSVAEHARADGRQFITGVVLAYEIFCRFCDAAHNHGFDNTNFCRVAVAVAAAKLLGLSPGQLSHCISIATVAENALRQVRMGHLSMFKAAASGHAGRAGVYAAQLARAGMEGPHLPFEGKAGWCDHVAGERFSLDIEVGKSSFKILDTRIKTRPSVGNTIPSIIAAEKIGPLKDVRRVRTVHVEVYKTAKDKVGTGDHLWNPQSKETADHSIPYVVAATLLDGTINSRSFDDAHLHNPELRSLLQKIEIVENLEFTVAYAKLPVEHRTRVTVIMKDGERLVAESGGDQDDLGAQRTDAQIVDKFRSLSEDVLGTARVKTILDILWHLDDVDDVAVIPAAFVFA